jgi:hypothetical protein
LDCESKIRVAFVDIIYPLSRSPSSPTRTQLTTLNKRSSMLTGDRLHIVGLSYKLSHSSFDFHPATQDLVCTLYFDSTTPYTTLRTVCFSLCQRLLRNAVRLGEVSSNALLNSLSDFALRKIATALFSFPLHSRLHLHHPLLTVHSFHNTSTIHRLQARRKSVQS